jgi:hypothetical protein
MSISTMNVFGPTFTPGLAGNVRPIVVWDDFVTGGTVLKTFGQFDQSPSAKFTDVDDTGEWRLRATGSPTTYPTMADEVGGVVTMTTGVSADNKIQAQLNGTMFSLANGRELYFEVRFNVSSTADFYVGVTDTDGTLVNFDNGVVCGITGTSTVVYRLENAAEANSYVNTAATITSGAYHVLAFKCRADKKVEFYLDGAKIALVNLPGSFPDSEPLSPNFQVNANSSGAETLKIDYILCVGER